MINQQLETISIQKTARFSSQGNPKTAEYFIIALHGYGQLSKYFIQKFNELTSNYFIVAPEGMHRFYLNGTAGRVGASWMTKEAREQDIADNINYLDTLIQTYSAYNFKKVILIGFSQGGATAARYLHLGNVKIDHFIVWASVFPPDLEIKSKINSKKAIPTNYFVIGSDDEYFTDESRTETANYFKSINYSVVEYLGNHSIDWDVLSAILREIE